MGKCKVQTNASCELSVEPENAPATRTGLSREGHAKTEARRSRQLS